MAKIEHCFFWFRRDLRTEDNHGFWQALRSGKKVIPVFIFDTQILSELPKKDRRVAFIHEQLCELQTQFRAQHSDIVVVHESPLQAWTFIYDKFGAADIYTNRDYEPYAINRDKEISEFSKNFGHVLLDFKDQVIFEKNEVLKNDGTPYTVFTPYCNRWRSLLQADQFKEYLSQELLTHLHHFHTENIPSFESLGFESTNSEVVAMNMSKTLLSAYAETRDIPSINGTSRVSVHLRFGTISIRKLFRTAQQFSEKWMNELIWREFYMQILAHFPHVIGHAFKPQYDRIIWRNNETEFEAWCTGTTGYPIVDAGMRELNQSGFMHNRVRMIVASFLTKHLLVDWRWGEAYFAEKLLDFELANNNGGWQWAAGCGVDAAPYFRIFNPYIQTKKFDPELKYIRQWLHEFETDRYPNEIVNHESARQRCLETYKVALSS